VGTHVHDRRRAVARVLAALAREGARLNMEIFSPGWGGTRVSFFAAGVNLRRTGRLEDAEEYSLEYRSVFDQIAEHPQDPKSQFGEFLLARARLLRGELSPQEALPVIEAFVAAKEKTYYSTFYGLGLTAKMLCLIRLGRFTDAEALVPELPDELMKAMPRDHHERRLYRATLVELYEGLGDHEKADEYREQTPAA
jgi:tetratricopeptide (TPR) repeat protein